MQCTSVCGIKMKPFIFKLSMLALVPYLCFIIILPTYPEMMHQHENGLLTKDQVYTNVSPTDQDNNGQTLILKVDQTFSFDSRNYAWDSRDDMWNWSSRFYIDGIWSYDKQARTITLTTTKFHASLDQPIENEQAVLDKGFPNRVVSTPNFDLETSKEIRCFDVRWEYRNFSKVVQGTLKRK